MLPLSVAIITKNEEHNIEDALKSIADATEIIVVDSFSSDKTAEICREYTNKVFQHKWEGFARQKQKAVDYTTGKWVLILDADERVSPELKKEIESVISNTDCNGYYIPRENYFIGKWIKHGGWWPDHSLRLFQRDKGHFEIRAVHEKVVVEGQTAYLKNPLKHYTYSSISDFVLRADNYSTLAAKEIIKRSGNTGFFAFIVKPIATFTKMYFIRLGFLDGKSGLILALLYSYYTLLKYLKAWEKE